MGLIAIHNKRLFLLLCCRIHPMDGANKNIKSETDLNVCVRGAKPHTKDNFHVIRMTECFFWPNICIFVYMHWGDRKKKTKRNEMIRIKPVIAFVAFSWRSKVTTHICYALTAPFKCERKMSVIQKDTAREGERGRERAWEGESGLEKKNALNPLRKWS